MKRALRSLLFVTLACLAAAHVTAYGETSMPPSSTTPLCIGRLLVDLPPDAQASISTSYQWMESETPVRINNFADLEEKLVKRAHEYKAVRMVRTPEDDRSWRRAGYDPDKLYAATQLVGFQADPALQQVVIGYHPESRSAKVKAELHKVIDRKDYIFDVNEVPGASAYPRTQQILWKAGEAFQPLTPGELPHKPGFCVEGGMFADSGKPPVREGFTLVVSFTDHPDVRFIIDASAIDQVDKDEPSLRFRVDSELGILRASVSHVHVLERGELTAAGQHGYQIALSAPNDLLPNTVVRKFFWSADGVPNDVTRPFMEIDLTIQPTDQGKTTITSDAEAKALWKQLLQGIRIRPGAV